MHAIAFGMVISDLKLHYGEQYHSAYSEIKKIMKDNDFHWIQGSTYITEESLIVVTMAMNGLNKIDWFRKSVRDIRAFRIEDWSDFTPMFKKQKK
ncbi:MAG: virulence protein [Chitinophagales bacterium]|nr:virulence protein [Chitinophagales bacterium]